MLERYGKRGQRSVSHFLVDFGFWHQKSNSVFLIFGLCFVCFFSTVLGVECVFSAPPSSSFSGPKFSVCRVISRELSPAAIIMDSRRAIRLLGQKIYKKNLVSSDLNWLFGLGFHSFRCCEKHKSIGSKQRSNQSGIGQRTEGIVDEAKVEMARGNEKGVGGHRGQSARHKQRLKNNKWK